MGFGGFYGVQGLGILGFWAFGIWGLRIEGFTVFRLLMSISLFGVDDRAYPPMCLHFEHPFQ